MISRNAKAGRDAAPPNRERKAIGVTGHAEATVAQSALVEQHRQNKLQAIGVTGHAEALVAQSALVEQHRQNKLLATETW